MFHSGRRSPRLNLERRRSVPRESERIDNGRGNGDVDFTLQAETRRPDVFFNGERGGDGETGEGGFESSRVREEGVGL
jgi:hypothetical protein